MLSAQDEEFAQGLLADFHGQSELAVDVKFDTEADKSVSLYFELTRRKGSTPLRRLLEQ